jgi:hypothetical protein
MVELDKDFVGYLKSLRKAKHEYYKDTVEYAEDLAVHAYGRKPYKILERVRPREEESIKEYRLESYEPKTKSKFDEACKVMKKMFNPSLYSIDWPGSIKGVPEDRTLQIYVEEEFPIRGSVINYLKEVGIKSVLSNPNGVFCVLFGKEVEQNEFRKPIVKFYEEDRILDFSEEFVVIHLSGELGKDALYMAFDIDGIYKIREEKTGQTHKFTLEEEKKHNFGSVPVWKAGGIYEEGIFKSFFDSAIPFWNKAIAHDSDLDGVYINHAFPYMWSIEIDCTNDDCVNGNVRAIKGDNASTLIKCNTCAGTGKQLSKSPYDMFTVNEDKFSENPSIVPPAGYISPDPAIISALDEKVERLMQQGMEVLKMHVLVGGNQSGRAKEWDKKELNESIREVSDLIFNIHYTNMVFYINKYRYGNDENVSQQLPVVNEPHNFDILTVSDLTSEISEATTANVSSHYVESLTKDATNKRFSSDIKERNRLNTIIELDPFSSVTIDDKMVMVSDGTADKIDIKISNNIKRYVDQAISEVPGFLEKPNDEKYKILQGYAGISDVTVPIDGTVQFNDQGGDDIDTPVDVEAEAKAKLKGSVGGVQGILEIQKSVSEGITQYSAALVLLNEIYGFEEKTATAMLGSEKSIPKQPAQVVTADEVT